MDSSVDHVRRHFRRSGNSWRGDRVVICGALLSSNIATPATDDDWAEQSRELAQDASRNSFDCERPERC